MRGYCPDRWIYSLLVASALWLWHVFPSGTFLGQTGTLLQLTMKPKLSRPPERQPISFCICCSVLALRPQSSAKKKKKVSDDSLFDLYDSLQLPEVEQPAAHPVIDWDSIIAYLKGISQHIREHHAKEGGARTQPCFSPFVTGKASDSSRSFKTFTIMELQAWWTCCGAKLLHDLPQVVPADRVESLCHTDKGHAEVAVLLLAFFLELARSKNHVRCPTFGTEAALKAVNGPVAYDI